MWFNQNVKNIYKKKKDKQYTDKTKIGVPELLVHEYH